MSYEEVMAEYELTKEDILAALDYAARHLSSEEIRTASETKKRDMRDGP